MYYYLINNQVQMYFPSLVPLTSNLPNSHQYSRYFQSIHAPNAIFKAAPLLFHSASQAHMNFSSQFPPPSSLFPPAGEGQRHRPGRRPELRLRQQQRRAALRLWGRDLCKAGRRQSSRRQQQQVQHLLRLHLIPRLNNAQIHGQ